MAFHSDVYAGYSPTGIVIYRVDNNGSLVDEAIFDKHIGVTEAAWVNNAEIKLTVERVCGAQSCFERKLLKLENNKWNVQ